MLRIYGQNDEIKLKRQIYTLLTVGKKSLSADFWRVLACLEDRNGGKHLLLVSLQLVDVLYSRILARKEVKTKENQCKKFVLTKSNIVIHFLQSVTALEGRDGGYQLLLVCLQTVSVIRSRGLVGGVSSSHQDSAIFQVNLVENQPNSIYSNSRNFVFSPQYVKGMCVLPEVKMTTKS